MKNLYLFTDSFPYGKGETFLENEITYLSEKFENFYIIPIYSGYKNKLRNIPKNVKIYNPPFKSLKNKGELFIKGLFNRSPFIIFIINLMFLKKNWIPYYSL